LIASETLRLAPNNLWLWPSGGSQTWLALTSPGVVLNYWCNLQIKFITLDVRP
jgi:hypothetical protein